MILSALMKKGALREVATAIPATAATDEGRKAGKVARVATVAVANSPEGQTATPVPFPPICEDEPLPDPATESRRQRVLEMLAERPGIRYAVITDTEADPEAVLLTLAIRDRATCELRIPRAKYDPFLLLALIERHGGTIH